MMADVNPMQNDRRLRGRLMLIFLVVLFFAPLFLATYLYQYHRDWFVGSHTNVGVLYQPVQTLHEFHMQNLQGERVAFSDWRGRWALLMLVDGSCDLACRASLYKMRQVRLALSHDADRVQRFLLLEGTHDAGTMALMRNEYPGMPVVEPRQDGWSDARAQFGEHPAGTVYLVDPHGNLVLRYPPEAPAKGMLKDLKRLLKISNIG
jgi:cytochrome oxidase Cu insertion factor (SCO1/SenC/PrrC family)